MSIEDPEAVADFNRWLREEAPRRDGIAGGGVGFLNPMAGLGTQYSAWGGWKHPECQLFAGALNHADLAAVVARFAVTPWRRPEVAQLMIQDQEEDYFRLWMIREGTAKQFAPEEG